jgi:hypothetical protein
LSNVEATRKFIIENYDCEEFPNGGLKISLEFPDGAIQVVTLQVDEVSGEEYLFLGAPFATNNDLSAEQALNLASRAAPFGVGIVGDYFVLRHLIPLGDVDPSEIQFGIGYLAGQATVLTSNI